MPIQRLRNYSQHHNFRIDLKDSPTNHNEIITLVMHQSAFWEGGIAFLLFVNELVCSQFRHKELQNHVDMSIGINQFPLYTKSSTSAETKLSNSESENLTVSTFPCSLANFTALRW